MWRAGAIRPSNFSLVIFAGAPGHAPFQVWLEDWPAGAGSRRHPPASNVAVDLTLTDLKGPLLHGQAGYSQKGPDPATPHLLQFPLEPNRAVVVGDTSFPVQGLSWQDHEYHASGWRKIRLAGIGLRCNLTTTARFFRFARMMARSILSTGSFVSPPAVASVDPEIDFSIEIGQVAKPAQRRRIPCRLDCQRAVAGSAPHVV